MEEIFTKFSKFIWLKLKFEIKNYKRKQKRLKEKNKKKVKPSRGVMICDLVTRKNINLLFGSFTAKVFSEICYHERTFIAFKTNEQYFGHIHDIFCLNVSKFGICVHYGMASNVAEQIFRHVSQKTPLFIF